MQWPRLENKTETYVNSCGKTIVKIIPGERIAHNVAIYCRVSTLHEDQQNSLAAQIEYFRKYIASKPGWVLAGEYVESKSGRDIGRRKEFLRMLDDCRAGKIDIVITKSISRFGRNLVDTLNILRELRCLNIDVYFENEELHSISPEGELYLSIAAAYAEKESLSRSENIKWGIERQAENNPDAPIYTRPCFGYRRNGASNLKIVPDEAKIVRLIFKLYLDGASVHGIRKELARLQIKTPTGNTTWSKRTVETILANEKYTGDSVVYKTYCADYPNKQRITNKGERPIYKVSGHHPAIISQETFAKVQAEKQRRTNVEYNSDGSTHRKPTHYSMKTTKTSKAK